MPDPINALQNLASQGTRAPQMVGMGSGPGQQPVNQQMMQNPNNNMGASNLMQTLTMQRSGPQQPPQQMPPNVVMQQQQNRMPMPNQMGNMNQGQMGNQMNMNQVVPPNANMNMAGNQMNQGPMQMVPQNAPMNPAMNQGMNQMAINAPGNQMNQMNTGMMGNPGMGNMNQQVPVQINPNCQINQGGGMNPNPAQMQAANQAQARGSPMGAGVNQMNPQHMMGIMQRNQQAGPGVFPTVRSVTPNFMNQSPSSSVPSPHQGGQMVPSPALVPSPSPQMPPQQGRNIPNVMAPSPSASINTPGQSQAVPSPLNPQDEQTYREKYRQLTKYIDPLKRMISRMGSDGKFKSFSFSNLTLTFLFIFQTAND